MKYNDMFESFTNLNSSNNRIEFDITKQLASRFKISPERIKLYDVIYDPVSKVLDFEIEIMNMHKSAADEMPSASIYEQLSKLINARTFTLKVNGTDVSINKVKRSSDTSSSVERYSDPSLYIPNVFKEDIGYLENKIRGYRENKELTNFWVIDKKTGKLSLPVVTVEEEEEEERMS
jgi:hypothetical protein